MQPDGLAVNSIVLNELQICFFKIDTLISGDDVCIPLLVC